MLLMHLFKFLVQFWVWCWRNHTCEVSFLPKVFSFICFSDLLRLNSLWKKLNICSLKALFLPYVNWTKKHQTQNPNLAGSIHYICAVNESSLTKGLMHEQDILFFSLGFTLFSRTYRHHFLLTLCPILIRVVFCSLSKILHYRMEKLSIH